MLRQASSRNQRSKGFKIKHGLQICLLIAVCIWLLYQVKHSHDKKRALLRSKLLNNNVDKKDDFFKFGRKDLPQIEESSKVAVNEETQEDEAEEDQDTKQDDNVNEIEIDEDKDAKEDFIDEQDQEKGDEEEEPEHLDESIEEEDKDNNNEINIEEEKDEHSEVDIFDNNQEHEGSTQEAREENYKRDDASSAVVHDARATESETGAVVEKPLEEEPTIDKNDYDSDARGVNGTGSDTNTESLVNKVLQSETAANGTNDGTKMNAVQENFEEKGDITTTSNVTLNETVQNNSTNEVEVQNNTATLDDIANVNSTQNVYVLNNNTSPDEHAVKIDVPANNTSVESHEIILQNNGSANNSTVVEEHESENKVNLDENGNPILENVDEGRGENEETSEISVHDESSMEEERNDRIDMSTLPQVQNEVMTSYDEANE